MTNLKELCVKHKTQQLTQTLLSCDNKKEIGCTFINCNLNTTDPAQFRIANRCTVDSLVADVLSFKHH